MASLTTEKIFVEITDLISKYGGVCAAIPIPTGIADSRTSKTPPNAIEIRIRLDEVRVPAVLTQRSGQHTK